MNFWTFLDRNAFPLFWLAMIVLIVGKTSCASSAGSDRGCSVEIGHPTADGGAP